MRLTAEKASHATSYHMRLPGDQEIAIYVGLGHQRRMGRLWRRRGVAASTLTGARPIGAVFLVDMPRPLRARAQR